MLYISTRSKIDSFTAYRALHEMCAPDGGQFVPMQIPVLGGEEIADLKNCTFSHNMATVLNLFFSASLNEWDLEFAVGRNPVKMQEAGLKAHVAEMWHNHEKTYRCFQTSLLSLLGVECTESIGQWAQTAVKVSTLFGIYGLLSRSGISALDISVSTEDMVAAVYAKAMGLPIDKIICVCWENDPAWDFIQHKEWNANAPTTCASILEGLIFSRLGREEAVQFADCIRNRKTYRVQEENFAAFDDLYAVAVSDRRVSSVVNSVNRSSGYNISDDAAFTFGGLQDYRARTGESKDTLLLSSEKPKK